MVYPDFCQDLQNLATISQTNTNYVGLTEYAPLIDLPTCKVTPHSLCSKIEVSAMQCNYYPHTDNIGSSKSSTFQ